MCTRLYAENYKFLIKETTGVLNKLHHAPWFGTFNIAKMSTVPKISYTFNAIPRKIPRVYFQKPEGWADSKDHGKAIK
jgi:hypothetical protein